MNNVMKKQFTFGFALLLVLGTLAGCSTSTPKNSNSQVSGGGKTSIAQSSASNTLDSDKDGLPDNAEIVLGTDPQNIDSDGDGIDDKTDKNPVKLDTTFIKSTGQNGFKINSILVENNVDEATGKDASDHLEIFLQNMTTKDISDFTVYYEYKDQVDGSIQSYKLLANGFILPANGTKSIHIDISGKSGHFRANPNSSYYQNINPKDVTVIVNAKGYQAQELMVKKDKGGSEMAD